MSTYTVFPPWNQPERIPSTHICKFHNKTLSILYFQDIQTRDSCLKIWDHHVLPAQGSSLQPHPPRMKPLFFMVLIPRKGWHKTWQSESNTITEMGIGKGEKEFCLLCELQFEPSIIQVWPQPIIKSTFYIATSTINVRKSTTEIEIMKQNHFYC